MHIDPSLIYPDVNANIQTSQEVNANVQISKELNYKQVERDIKLYLTKSSLSEQEKVKFRRMILLGTAFEKEGNPLAKELFENWLFGPKLMDWDKQKTNSISQQYGAKLKFRETRPWYRLDWSRIKQISNTIYDLKLQVKREFEINLSKGILPKVLKEKLNDIVLNEKKTVKGKTFGDINTMSLEDPKLYAGVPISKSFSGLIFEEKKANLLSTVLNGITQIPDAAASLGSFSVFSYVKGTYDIIIKDNKKTGTFSIKALGLRIVDGFDFTSPEDQFLSVWYPYKGHSLTGLINSIPEQLRGDYNQVAFYNKDFDKLKSIVANYNSLNTKYKLKCEDYYVVTPMDIIKINEKIQAYEITIPV